MKKTILIFTTSLLFAILFVSSCVNHEYDSDNIDKQVVFSQNGLNIPVGSFDKIMLEFEIQGEIDSLSYEKDFQGFFTEELYKMFVIEENGVDKGIGYLELAADFSAYIKNDKEKIAMTVHAEVLDYKEKTLFVIGNNVLYASNNEDNLTVQPFSIKINKEDIPKLKKADILRFTFKLDAANITISSEDGNFVNIQNMRIKSSGGISLDIFDNED